MARAELRKPIDSLMQEKSKIDQQLTSIQDKYNVLHERLQKCRYEQHGLREAKETLSNSNQNKPARRVFDQDIATLQKTIDDTMRELDQVEKDRVVWASKNVAMAKSIKELQSA